jgi:hypothetical protein
MSGPLPATLPVSSAIRRCALRSGLRSQGGDRQARCRRALLSGRAEGGSATVEIAVALPALMLVTVAALWGITTASAQIACVDAVRAGARAAARGEPLPEVRAVVERAAPPGARAEVRRDRETTAVAVSVALRPPALTGFPALTVRAHALAATEPGVGVP